jgi:hypothetical protein
MSYQEYVPIRHVLASVICFSVRIVFTTIFEKTKCNKNRAHAGNNGQNPTIPYSYRKRWQTRILTLPKLCRNFIHSVECIDNCAITPGKNQQ